MTLPRRRSDDRGGLEAGQQDQRPGAGQVLQHTVQGREDQRQRAAQPADDAGTLSNQVRLAGGEELQLSVISSPAAADASHGTSGPGQR